MSYIADDISGVHWQPDPRVPRAACGIDFTGRRGVVRHPVVTGGAFSCTTCRDALAAGVLRPKGQDPVALLRSYLAQMANALGPPEATKANIDYDELMDAADGVAEWAGPVLEELERLRALEHTLLVEVGSAAKLNRDLDWADWERHGITPHRGVWPPFHHPEAEMRTYTRHVSPWVRMDNGEWSDPPA